MTLVANKSERQNMTAANVGGQGMGRFKQRQAEKITYEVDYSGWLADGETITAAVYTIAPITDPTGDIVGSTISGGNTLLFQFDNGYEGTRYTVNIEVTTSTGQTKLDYFSITIGTFSNEAAQVDVVSATSQAITAKDLAVAAKTAAQTSATNAATSANTALSAATTATNKAAEAAGYVTTVASSVTAAATSATNAATSATNAANSATTSTTKATEAAQYASSASGAASLADQRATAAETARTTAVSSASAATTSASQAATSATNAANSATAAATSATNAATSATNSATSATTATTKATEATTSATSAAGSATTATTKASEAATSATSAAASATTATTKASEAATSATNAASSATTATTKATEAATSATSAAGSATTATTKATEAATSATNAAGSATTATTKASEAATSATNSANSATASATSAGNAATSATAAATSATNANNSATAAGSAQAAAESARDATLAAYDSFDDRYLGVKASDPTLDNDGNALVAGALYFSSTVGAMKVYTGSNWTAAYISGIGVLAASNNLADLTSVSTARSNLGLSTVAATGSYSDLINQPTLFSGAYADLTGKPSLFSGSYTDLSNKPTFFSGAYNDLTGKPTLGTAAAQDTTAFAAASHTQAISTITGLQTELDGKQPLDADLTAIAALAGTSGLLKKTAADTWSLDTTAYHSGTLGVDQGGTGLTSLTSGYIPFGNGTSAFGSSANLSFNNSTNQFSVASGSEATPAISTSGDTDTGIFFPAANMVSIGTFGTERVRVDGQKVGVAPSTLFGAGNGYAGNTAASAKGELDLYNGGTGATTLRNTGAFPIIFSTNNQERMRITSAGYVGIGKSSPTSMLDVAGTARSTSLYVANSRRVLDSYEDNSSNIIFAAEDYNGSYPFLVDTANNTIVGTGNVTTGTNRSTELLYIPIATSTPTGTPFSYAGHVPLVFNTADNKLYLHNGTSWLSAQFA